MINLLRWLQTSSLKLSLLRLRWDSTTYDEGVDEDSLQDDYQEDENTDDCGEDDEEDDFHEYDDDCELDNNEDYCEIDAENITNESELRLKRDFKDDEDAIPEKTVR